MPTGMIVDDADIMRLRLKDMLAGRYEIIAEARDGEEAVMMYEKHKPDFVTLDITMPKMNGLQVLENLIKKDPDAKIVIVSAVGQKQLVFQALAAGAKDFIVKPFEAERVRVAIDRLFG